MRQRNFLRLSNRQKQRVLEYGTKRGWSWRKLTKRYKQPSWCTYPNAMYGKFGCWSLLGFGDETKDMYKNKCQGCDCKFKGNIGSIINVEWSIDKKTGQE